MSNYTIGKGKVLFKPLGASAFKDLGNCPDFKVTPSIETKEHFSSRSGLQKKDKQVVVKQEAVAAFTLDEPHIDNLDLFVMGSGKSTSSQVAGNVTDQNVTAVLDEWIELGKVDLSNVMLTDDPASVTYVEGTDYELDSKAGLLKCLSGGSITQSQALLVDFDYANATIEKAYSAQSTKIEGDLYFVGNPPVGAVLDVKGFGSLKPTGDLPLIGEDWMQFGFELEFLESTNFTGLYEIHKRGTV